MTGDWLSQVTYLGDKLILHGVILSMERVGDLWNVSVLNSSIQYLHMNEGQVLAFAHGLLAGLEFQDVQP